MIKKIWTQAGVAGLLSTTLLVLLSGCSSVVLPDRLLHSHIAPLPQPISDNDQMDLETVLKGDLARSTLRANEVALVVAQRRPVASQTAENRDAPHMSIRLQLDALPMPVVGIFPAELEDSFGDSRDGGKRKHKGIDIFAAKGSEIVAVADGIVSYIGEQRLGGRCLWLVTETGMSFYYAHLDRWATGLFEGEAVRVGDLLGYVGNTGNAAHTPSHLHFQVERDDEVVDPYPLLKADGRMLQVHRTGPLLEGGFGHVGSK